MNWWPPLLHRLRLRRRRGQAGAADAAEARQDATRAIVDAQRRRRAIQHETNLFADQVAAAMAGRRGR